MKKNMLFLVMISVVFTFKVNANDKKILIFTNENQDFVTVENYLKESLSDGFLVVSKIIKKDSTFDFFNEQVKTVSPNLIVLMDNQSVEFAKKYYTQNKESKIQSVAIMGLNYKHYLKDFKNICGVAYEVPIYTLITGFRYSLENKKVKRIFTFYRASLFKDTIELAKERLQKESIELIAVDVDKQIDNLKEFLALNIKKINKNTDAIFILLDSVLLSRNLFKDFWLPFAQESKIPIVAGTKFMVGPKLKFATFGMGPSLIDLADQTSQMIESILLYDRKCADIGVEDLIGVQSFWSKKMGEKLNLKLDKNSSKSIEILP